MAKMNRTRSLLAATSVVAILAGCSDIGLLNRETGTAPEFGAYGASVNQNAGVQSGEIEWVQALGRRFNQEVPDTINFAFNSAVIDAQAAAILTRQADWIRQFPEVRFRVYGHTDLVGSTAYNKSLGLRRANAVVSFFAQHGISRSRLEARVSYGESQPVINTPGPERRNRRTVTEVTGFVETSPQLLNGKYAAVVQREYVEGATWQANPTGVGRGIGQTDSSQ